MKAAVLVEPGRIELESRTAPRPRGGEVLVQVLQVTLCGTDVKIARDGHFKLRKGDTRVLGHEIFGVVSEVGSDQEHFLPGDFVGLTPNVGCGVCRMCLRGLNQMCPKYEAFGVSMDGGLQERLLIPEWVLARGNLFKLPTGISSDWPSLLEPASCCFSGQERIDIAIGDSVLIVGAGPIGAIHARIARARGAGMVIVANRSEGRLEQIECDLRINTSSSDLYDEIMRVTSGEGVDAVLLAAADPALAEVGTRLLSRHGRLNVFSGIGARENPKLEANLIHYRSLTITGTTGSSNLDYARTLQLVHQRQLSLEGLVTHSYPLDEAQAALENAMQGRGMKTMIQVSSLV